ncbi:4Fe-4S dicluster domain-containing protein [Geomonas sp.]|uniref:4Fe-4S dicluster domain-containing protein n=1 Tax=Geomonas sp. TaxID=2651584 RepID=UPI002B4923E8|nr:4Fe-4S dicluster domain-containing protein [Geomonas sp.]HJV34370.1 4Fe-4S dicluster domain-containing protein [Geomonas sp.]
MSSESPTVEVKRCTGCGRCVSACPEKLFTLEVAGYRKHAALRCTTCGRCLKCLDACPVGALSILSEDSETNPPQ